MASDVLFRNLGDSGFTKPESLITCGTFGIARVSMVASEEFPKPLRYGVCRKELHRGAKIAQRDSDQQRDPIEFHLALKIPPRFIQRNFQALPGHSQVTGNAVYLALSEKAQ
jgi:hypothetical protein